ncbi:glycosyltransferase [Jatrophihabitans sp. YIM 134969]
MPGTLRALAALPARLPVAGPRRLAADIDLLGGERRRAVRSRLATLAHVLDPSRPPTADTRRTVELVETVVDVLDPADADQVWLAAAVVGGRMPSSVQVLAARRRARLDGVAAALAELVPRVQLEWPPPDGRFSPLAAEWPDVEVVTGEVLVDVFHTADTDLATGIQRVTRESVRRWARDHDVTLVSWTSTFTGLKPLTGAARERALTGTPAQSQDGRPTVTIPWRCSYVLPELAAEPDRTTAIEAMVEYSCVRSAMIGFDCVPVTSAETVGEGMGGGFSTMLGAASQLDRVAAISEAAAGEYGGWREMLAGTGLPGPEIRAISLPDEAVPVEQAAVDAARSALGIPSLPLVLVVGSHEPRKNHLAVLHAADLCWRKGLRFNLVFVGGNAWRGEEFTARLHQLQDQGRSVQAVSGVSDAVLAGSYALARFTVFPSLNEGFGLPIVESLAQGTPVVTSGYGSMAEIAAGGGAVTVDPRRDDDIASAIERLLTDDDLLEELAEQARNRAVRTWDQYAAETWSFFMADDRSGATS